MKFFLLFALNACFFLFIIKTLFLLSGQQLFGPFSTGQALFPNFLNLLALAGVSPYTWFYDFVETCVFGKQSPRRDYYESLSEEAPFSRSYEGYFSKFLGESCLAPLCILYLPTL